MVSLRNNIPEGWEGLWKNANDELEELEEMLDEKMKRDRVYPKTCDIFRVFTTMKPEEIRIIILGQDPYHQTLADGSCRATGLSFSVKKEDEVPTSLKNIYKEINSCYLDFRAPFHGNLETWTHKGIFLLNACLTVKPNAAGSHGKIWKGFIRKAIMYINEKSKGPVYLLWGKEAQSYSEFIAGCLMYNDFTDSVQRNKYLKSEKPVVLTAPHPSGFSAHKGFFGCRHFKIVNDIMEIRNKPMIDWSLN